MKKTETLTKYSSIREAAEILLAAEEKARQKEESKILSEAEKHEKHLKAEFEAAFKDVLPLLEKEGITYEVGMNDRKYPHLDGYVKLTLKGRSLLMDFTDRNNYRYEYTYSRNSRAIGTMVFGKWDMEKFLLWIWTDLIQKVEADQEV